MLAVSTDPAHSLRDALGPRIPRRLRAVELDAPRAFARWMARHRRAAAEAFEHGTWLDREDIDTLLDLPIPGIDELLGLIETDRLARPSNGAYDIVVVDTAPTGHTLRLLAAPELVGRVAGVLDHLQEEHRIIRTQLARIGRPEAADRLIEELAQQGSRLGARLRSRAETRFHWVTLAETLSVAETNDALAALASRRILVPEIVVNRVLTDEGPCPICDRRRAEQTTIVRDIRRTLGRNRRVTIVPAQSREPRGVKALQAIAHAFARTRDPQTTGLDETVRLGGRVPPAKRRPEGRAASLPAGAATVDDPASLDAIRGAHLIFVGGKGGVGKTTVAAAMALSVARARPQRRVLLLSTDPAHSVRDVFDARVPPVLHVLELDAVAAFAARAKELQEAIAEIGERASGAEELFNLAPPGVDELFGMLTIFNARHRYDTIVVDMAPTGHALRLLETPEAARAWVQVLMRLLLKYREVVHANRFAEELVGMSKGIRELEAFLRDPASTRFLVVTRAAELPRRESRRLVQQLRRLRLATQAVIVNAMTLGPGDCRRCRQTAADERLQIRALGRVLRRRVIIKTPLAAPAPRGVAALDEWRRTWVVER